MQTGYLHTHSVYTLIGKVSNKILQILHNILVVDKMDSIKKPLVELLQYLLKKLNKKSTFIKLYFSDKLRKHRPPTNSSRTVIIKLFSLPTTPMPHDCYSSNLSSLIFTLLLCNFRIY